MYLDDERDHVPLLYVGRRFAGLIALLLCVFCAVSVHSLWQKREAFAQAPTARATILEITSRGCRPFDHCLDNQEAVYEATVAFRDRHGRAQRAQVDLRWPGRRRGGSLEIHYLADAPGRAIAGDLTLARQIWLILMLQLAIGGAVCGAGAFACFFLKDRQRVP